jgi:hypothetical protein
VTCPDWISPPEVSQITWHKRNLRFFYWTISVRGKDWLFEPAAAVTVSVYCPAGVPLEVLPPPHEQIASSSNKDRPFRHREADRLDCKPGDSSHPNTTMAQSHGAWLIDRPALVRDVVVTVTASGDGDVASKVMLPGTEQMAPLGAPVQVSVAVPAKPAPPITRLYAAVAPAATVADPDPPDAIASPKLMPVPETGTACGLPEALSG